MLRISVAVLARVLFHHPIHGEMMLALERKATLLDHEDPPGVAIKIQPFGGAIRIKNPNALQEVIGKFHFDSESSRAVQDFRIFIDPTTWPKLHDYCMEHLSHEADSVLETNPDRELKEEFQDALGIELNTGQFTRKPIGIVLDDDPKNILINRKSGHITVRLYRIYEVMITDPSLARMMMEISDQITHQDLSAAAIKDFQNGGKGRANAILVVPLKIITSLLNSKPVEIQKALNLPENVKFEDNNFAILKS